MKRPFFHPDLERVCRMPAPFTAAAYERLCRAIRDSGLRPLRVVDYLEARPRTGFVILRYDVDARPDHAVWMAHLLYRHGLCGSFYWHAAPPRLHRLDCMREVAALGHELGYHHDALARCKGDIEAAATQFARDIATFRAEGFDIRTAAAHGSPGFDTQQLLRERPDLLAACALTGEAYASIDFSHVQYISDAGWAWRKFPLRVDAQQVRAERGAGSFPVLRDADVLLLLADTTARLYLNTHPELWFASAWEARFRRWRRRAGRGVQQMLRGRG